MLPLKLTLLLLLATPTHVYSQDNVIPSESACSSDMIMSEEELQERFQDLKTSEVLCIGAVDVILTQSLTLMTNNVTIRGQGQEETTIRCPKSISPALIIRGNHSRTEGITFTDCDDETAVIVNATGTRNSEILMASFCNLGFLGNGKNNRTMKGGAFHIAGCSEPNCSPAVVAISFSKFELNHATIGGAIYGNKIQLEISNSTFEKNQASRAGGAIFLVQKKTRLEIKSSNFSQNNVTKEFRRGASFRAEEEIFEEDIKRFGGGAIFAKDIETLKILDSVVENNSACGTGGALSIVSYQSDELPGQSPNIEILRSEFKDNKAECSVRPRKQPALASQSYFGSGGGIFVWSDDGFQGNMTVEECKFGRNRARRGGGIYLEQPSLIKHLIRSCHFFKNSAEVNGGGGFARNTRVEVSGCNFIENESRGGGGLCCAVGANVTIHREGETNKATLFHSNLAVNGGGMQIFDTVTAEICYAVFTNNTASRHGGGFRVSDSKLFIALRAVIFEDNVAPVGGGMAIFGARNISVTGRYEDWTVFRRNVAIVGGGLYYQSGHAPVARMLVRDDSQKQVFPDERCVVTDRSRLNDSFADTVPELQHRGIVRSMVGNFNASGIVNFLFSDLSKSPPGQGGGFYVELGDPNVFVIKEVILRDVSARQNRAVVGGGGVIHSSNASWNTGNRLRCFPAEVELDVCQKLIFQNVSITDNMADYAGGLFSPRPNTILTTCNAREEGRSSTLLEVMKNRLSNSAKNWDVETDLLCTDIHSNSNQDGNLKGGEDIGSDAALLVYNRTGHLKRVASGENLTLACDPETGDECPRNFTVSVRDAFNQTIHGGIPDAALRIVVSSENIVGETRYRAENGIAKITGTRAWGINVSSEMTIQTRRGPLFSVRVNFSTSACEIGDFIAGHECHTCPPGQYAFNSSSENCLPCEEYANCTGGSVLIPVKGYWHSSPFSPQFHRCVLEKACSNSSRGKALQAYYKNQTRLQEDLQRLELYIEEKHGERGFVARPEFDDYEQCSKGYEGVFCGSCSEDYGHGPSGQCEKCPKNAWLGVVVPVFRFLWVFVLIASNSVITLSSAKARVQLEHHKRLQGTRRTMTSHLSRATRHLNKRTADGTMQRTEAVEASLAALTTDEFELLESKLIASVYLSEMLKIGVNYLQIVSIAFHIPVKWGELLHGWLTLQSSVSQSSSDGFFANSECLAHMLGFEHSAIVALWMKCLTPFAIMCAILFAFTLIWGFFHRTIWQTDSDVITTQVFHSWTTGATVIIVSSIFFAFVGTTEELLKAINCIEVDEKLEIADIHPYEDYAIRQDHRVWVADTEYVCFRGRHLPTGIVGSCGLLLSAVVIFFAMFWHKLNKQRSGDIKYIARYSFLYQAYRKDRWFTTAWEAVILLRKAMLVSVVQFSYHLGPNLQAALAVGILVVALVLQNGIAPFRVDTQHVSVPNCFKRFCGIQDSSGLFASFIDFSNQLTLNTLEASSLFCSLTVFFSALIINDAKSTDAGKYAFIAFSFFINLLFVAFLLFRIYAGFHVFLDLALAQYNLNQSAQQGDGSGLQYMHSKLLKMASIFYEDFKALALKRLKWESQRGLNRQPESFPTSMGAVVEEDGDVEAGSSHPLNDC